MSTPTMPGDGARPSYLPPTGSPIVAMPSVAAPTATMPTLPQAPAPFSPEADAAAAPAPKRTSPGRWAYRIALWTVTILALAITAIPFMMERSGTKLVTITSGSMTPLYPVGATLVIDPSVDKSTLQPGQVITFVNPAKVTVTHRIVKRVQNSSLQGVWYQTKGDANNTPDADLSSAQAVLGVVEGPVTWWQQLAIAGQTPKGRLLVFGSLFILVALGEGTDLVRSLRRRKEGAA